MNEDKTALLTSLKLMGYLEAKVVIDEEGDPVIEYPCCTGDHSSYGYFTITEPKVLILDLFKCCVCGGTHKVYCNVTEEDIAAARATGRPYNLYKRQDTWHELQERFD